MKRVSLKMIAREAGVSVSTVSLALRNTGTLSREMTERVQKVAKKMGYRPNPVLAALASKRFSENASLAGTPVALLGYPIDGVEGPPPNFYTNRLEFNAKEFGYSTLLLTGDDLENYNDLPRMLYNRGVAGVIVYGQAPTDLFQSPDDWTPFSLVQCGRFRSSLRLSCVRPNIFQAIKMVFEKAYERGYRRIGFCFGQHKVTLEDDEARFGVALRMQNRLPPKARIPIYEGGVDDDEAKMRWVQKHKPEIVIGFSSHEWYLLKDAGYKIPQDISFVSLQLDPYHIKRNEIAGLDQQSNKIAQECIVLMDQMIRHKTVGIPELPLDILLPSTWHEAPSIECRL